MRQLVKLTALSALALLSISSCSTIDSDLIVEPPTVTSQLSGSVSRLMVQDKRPHSYLYRHIDKETQKANQFSAPSQPLTAIVKQAFQQSGIVSGQGDLNWYVSINKAVVEHTETALKYQLDYQLNIRVEAQRMNRSYARTFTGTGKSEGVSNPDEATIEREFKRLLQQVLNDIANDPQLRLTETRG